MAEPGCDIATPLLSWYDAHARDLPWRVGPAARKAGARPDPYRVWLSEIMLQQTTVATVAPRFEAFLEKWPSIEALAAADIEDVLGEWAGLGYYARARNLHACARFIFDELEGKFPDTEEALQRLPGVGPYTAGAIAAIAFDRPASAPDGNVERVMARLHTVAEPLPGAKPMLRELAASHVPTARAGDYAQALMDLGATVCTPKSPSCLLCPLQAPCGAGTPGAAAAFPHKDRKKPKEVRRGVAFVLRRPDGAALFERRPANIMLGGLLGFPGTPWWDRGRWRSTLSDPLAHAPVASDWSSAGGVEHVFTHFRLELDVLHAVGEADGIWRDESARNELPTLMRKVWSRVPS